MKPAVTYKIAHAAGQDAGNRQAKRAGRKTWSRADWNAAARTTRRLLKLSK